MIKFAIAFGVILVLALLYVLSLRCRKGHPGFAKLRGWKYAHRGFHGNGVPENSMQAFRLALEKGYGIELDVHLMKDGNLAVIHDGSLKRTAGVDVKIGDLTVSDLENYRLEGTDEKIPLFSDVLRLFEGKAPMIVELKAGRDIGGLCIAVCEMLDRYQVDYCIESFDPRCVMWLKKHRPEIVRGFLSENFLKNKKSKLPVPLKWVLSSLFVNFLMVPDFVAYRFSHRNTLGNKLCRKVWGVQKVGWTIRSQEELNDAIAEDWIPIFEYFEP